MEARRIGEILIAEGWLSEGAVERALAFQRSSVDHIKLGTILIEWDLLAEDTLLESLSKLHRCPPVTWEMLAGASIPAVRLVAGSHAIRLSAMPYGLEKGLLKVAFANPSNLMAIDEISVITGKRLLPGVTSEVRLMQAHQRFYGRHIPLEFRSVVQKLGRETRRRRVPGTRIGSPPLPPLGSGTAPDPGLGSPVEDDFAQLLSITIPEIPLLNPLPRPIPDEGALLDRATQGSDAGDPAGAEPSGRQTPSPSASPSFEEMWRSPGSSSVEHAAAAPALWISAERDFREQSVEARTREEIGEAILDSQLTEIPRVILLGVGKTAIAGWRGRGSGLTREKVEALRISTTESSVFSTVAEKGAPHFGTVPGAQWPGALQDLLGTASLDCAVFPVRVLNGIAAFLYADRLGEPMRAEDYPVVARAAISASNVLARFLLQPVV